MIAHKLGCERRSVLAVQKSILLMSGVLWAATSVSSTAQAECTLGGRIGPGGDQFINFLAATSSATTSAVTAMNTAFQTQTSAFLTSPQGTQPDQLAGGTWGRAVGGRLDTDSVSSGTRTSAVAPIGPFPATCSTHTRNDFIGVQGGIDSGRLNLGGSGWNAHVGVTGGYFETDATSQQGSGLTRSQVPFVGLYGALVGGGGFFIDGQVAAQFYSLSVSEPSIGAQGGMQGTGIGVLSSAGYHWALGDYFIEPSVGVTYSRVSLDSLSISPTVFGQNVPTRTLPTVLSLSDIETLLGRAGVRFGTTFVTHGTAVEPFVAASVWREFAGDTSMNATFAAPNATFPTVNLSSNRIGTFGQYSLGVTASVLNTGWLGYARVDYRNGENIESLSVNGGIRYQFAPEPQVAAAPASQRMFTKAPPAAPPPTWTGLYLGGFAGGAWTGSVTATELAPGPGPNAFYNGIGTQTNYDLSPSGVVGLTLGYNYQMGSVVTGVEAEGGYLRLTGSAPFAINPETVSSTKVGDWYALLAGRLGFTVGPTLIYGKVGGALVNVTESVIDACGLSPPCTAVPHIATVAAAGGNPIGLAWVAGAGLEYALDKNWSVKGEYLFLGTNRSDVATGPGLIQGRLVGPPIGVPPQTFSWNHDIPGIQIAKIGLNYRF
jgi:opacity protein-like surface antigen